MPYTDAYGTWQELTPVFLTASFDWVLTPNPCPLSSELFRVKFETDWSKWNNYQGYQSYGLLRVSYSDDSGVHGNNVTPSFRIYPKQEEMLFNLPIIQKLSDNPWAIRKFQFKKIRKKRPFPRNVTVETLFNDFPDLDWKMYIEYLI